MQSRPLGTSVVNISRIVFGSMGSGPSEAEQAARVRLMHEAIDLGVTSIDTAPLYEFGHGERVVGKAISDRRDKVQILTKAGLRWDGDHGAVLFEGRNPDGGKRVVRRDSRPAAIRLDVEESLQRLGTDMLDVVQIHHPDELVPISDTIGTLLDLRADGKIGEIGVSNFSAAQVSEAQRAMAGGSLAVHQLRFSLLHRDGEAELIPQAVSQGIGVLAYSPLEKGALSNRPPDVLVDDQRRRGNPALQPHNRASLLAVREVLGKVAAERDLTVSQVSLAWALAQPGMTGCIAGTSTSDQLRENAAAGAVQLDRSELDAIDAVARANPIRQATLAQRIVRRLKRFARNRLR